MNILGTLQVTDFLADSIEAPGLYGPIGITHATIRGEDFFYITGEYDDAIQVVRLNADGTFDPIQKVPYSAGNALDAPQDIATLSVGNETYVAVTSYYGNSLSLFRIDNDNNGTNGELTNTDTLRNVDLGGSSGGTNALQNAFKVDAISVGGKAFIAATAYYGDALSIYEVDDQGKLSFKSAVFDNDSSNYHLNGASDVHFYTVGKKVFVYVCSNGDDGITVFEMNKSNGGLTYVDQVNLPDGGVVSFLPMSYNGQNVLLAISNQWLNVYTISNSGALTFKTQTNSNNLGTHYLGAPSLLTVDGVDFVVATEYGYSGTALNILSIADDYSIDVVRIISGGSFDNGQASISIEIGSQTYIVSTAFDTNRVSVTRVGGSADILVGTNVDDRIVGQDGDDDLLGKNGDDLLLGANGEDALIGHFGNDTLNGGDDDDVLVGAADNDLLIGGKGADFLKGGAGRDMMSYEGSSGAVKVNLATGLAKGGDAAGDIFVGIEDLRGSDRNDDVAGDGRANRIEGGKGNDTVAGGGGNDSLKGENGNDKIDGDSGNDRIDGGNGLDKLSGQDGDDTITGGSGKDVIDGGADDDDLNGNAGDDILIGGTGDDAMDGGTGRDTFDFAAGFGNDTITGFEVGTDGDILDLSAFSEITNLASFRAYALTISGNTILTFDDVNVSITMLGVSETQFTDDNFIY